MLIQKGTLLVINHSRKGTFEGIAKEDFDTELDEFYPIILASEYVGGMSEDWVAGEAIPCNRKFCQVHVK